MCGLYRVTPCSFLLDFVSFPFYSKNIRFSKEYPIVPYHSLFLYKIILKFFKSPLKVPYVAVIYALINLICKSNKNGEKHQIEIHNKKFSQFNIKHSINNIKLIKIY